MSLRHVAALLLLGAVWGGSFLLIKIGVSELPPETLVALRIAVAALVLLGVLYAGGQHLSANPRTWLTFFLLGLIGLVLPYLLITWAEQFIASGMAAILNATTPLFSLLLAAALSRDEQLGGWRSVGVALGFVGVLVAVGVESLASGPAASRLGLLPHLGVMLAALCYAITGLYARRAFAGTPPLVTATGQMVAAALLTTPLALVANGLPATMPSARVLIAVLLLAVFGTALAYVLVYWLMERIGATRTSMVTYLLPPFALVYGALLLQEPITAGALVGLALVLLGILLANGAGAGSWWQRERRAATRSSASK